MSSAESGISRAAPTSPNGTCSRSRCATATMSVVAKDVFVPEYKALGMLDARGGDKFPGAKANPNSAYCVPLSALGGHGIGACAVGNAQAALESTIASVKERSTSYTGAKMR